MLASRELKLAGSSSAWSERDPVEGFDQSLSRSARLGGVSGVIPLGKSFQQLKTTIAARWCVPASCDWPRPSAILSAEFCRRVLSRRTAKHGTHAPPSSDSLNNIFGNVLIGARV